MLKTNFSNKKGAGKILSAYWFVVLLIIAMGIFLMVYLFYGIPYDVRKLESRILMNQVADCVSYAGEINYSLIFNGYIVENNDNFLETCHLNFKADEWKVEQYYAEVNIYRLADLDTPILTIKKGNSDWKGDCSLQENKEYEKLAKCSEGIFYSVDNLNSQDYSVNNKNNQFIIKVLTAVRKSEKNVKL